ncbi:MAG: sugar ABC transporter ATP-binding protein [Clostridium sp.]|nr:sugar ABC transporter ATP-binding protein [Clostridium sp.]
MLKTVGLTKKFPGVIALNNVSLRIGYKEIHAIVGENGAGKSTFCNLITGVYQPDMGKIHLFGEEVSFSSPSHSLKSGISMVYQERTLLPFLTGAQNICLGREPSNLFFINEKEIRRWADDIRKQLGVSIPLDIPVGKLTPGIQQMIEILRAFSHNPKLLILDEPTASLGEGEIEPFLEFIKNVTETMDISIIFISHKLDEVFSIADKISVFADGRKVVTKIKSEITQDECIRLMIRRDLRQIGIEVDEHAERCEKPFLQVGDCNYDNAPHTLDFTVHKGEVVGMYGLVGSGRTECIEAIYGIRSAKHMDIKVNGKGLKNPTPYSMLKKGLVLVPESRDQALFNLFNLKENISIFALGKLNTGIFRTIDTKKEKRLSVDIADKSNVKYTDIIQSIEELSGGNKQKAIIGRSLAVDDMELIILDEPTRGIDLGAKEEIYILIRRIAEKDNKAVLVISSELPELLNICDRLYVFHEGNIVEEFARADFSKMEILNCALGRGKGGNNIEKDKRQI